MVDEQAAKVWAKKFLVAFEREPAFAHYGFQCTGNPYYAWWALNNCIKHKIEFPEWLIEYLGACAARMLSSEARAASDLREVLPSILGFPRKRGPGKLLDPDADPRDTLSFACRFLREIAEGRELSDALKEAAVATNCEATDDKTLRHWIQENFGLKEWPRDRREFIEKTRETLLDVRLLLSVGE
jgi:hypothetical protein